jgi:hypothetical protein
MHGRKSMKRREFLKGVTGASLAMVTSSIACNDNTPSTSQPSSAAAKLPTWHVDVVVHGMFAIVLDMDGTRYKNKPRVRLLAPRVTNYMPHHYLAKTFKAVGTDLQETWSQEVTLSAKSVSGALLFPSSPSPNNTTFDPSSDSSRIVITVDQTSDVQDKPGWMIDLPALPNDICQLRAANYNLLVPTSLTYQNSHMNYGQSTAIVHVIKYEFSAASAPSFSFSPDGGAPQALTFDGNVLRLHLFAEPNTAPVCNNAKECHDHLQDALGQFNQMFHQRLDLTLADTGSCICLDWDTVPDSCPEVLPCEERSLYELLHPEQYKCSEFTRKKPARQQIKEDPGIQAVQTQWDQLLDSKSKAGLAGKSLTTTSAVLYQQTRAYLGQKPPSNCMALVCKHGKLSN